MSLINKMLKDLDKRNAETGGNDPMRASVRSVTLGKQKKARPVMWVLLLLLVASSAAAAWFYRDNWLKKFQSAPKAMPSPLVSSAPPLVTATPPVATVVASPIEPGKVGETKTVDAPPRVATVVATPSAKPVQASVPKVVPPVTTSPAPVVLPPTRKVAATPAVKSPSVALAASTPSPSASTKTVAASSLEKPPQIVAQKAVQQTPPKPATQAATRSTAPVSAPLAAKPAAMPVPKAAATSNQFGVTAPKAIGDSKAIAAAAPSLASPVDKKKPVSAQTPLVTKSLKRGAVPTVDKTMKVEVTPQQQADNEYGKAVRLIEEGRRAEAIATLEGVLMKQYKHAAARQTLAGLLIEEKRSGEAIAVLQAGLRMDSSQTGMAMLLARLQVESGDSRTALSTLQQSLSYGKNKPEYQAFIAALYQRENRHKESIEHYRAAVGEVPSNGVWWMGYGISLQAVGRQADARVAFTQARDSGKLTPPLKAFVDQRLAALPQ